tara:strand:+ start:16277 stop:16693 length:417 start_codon:yes stop_codon:yes gene_type:complete
MVKVLKRQKRTYRTLKKKKGGGTTLSKIINSRLDIKPITTKENDKCDFVKIDIDSDNITEFLNYLKNLFKLNPELINIFIEKIDTKFIINFYEWINSNFHDSKLQHINDIKTMIKCTFRSEIDKRLISSSLYRKISDN